METVSITTSLPSGKSCIIAVPPDARVDQLKPKIERSLNVPKALQKIIAGTGDDARELPSQKTLAQAGLLDGGCVTVVRAWPEDEGAIVAIVELMSHSSNKHNQLVTESVAELLDRESVRIQLAAIQGLSWMGSAGAVHADKVARMLDARQVMVRTAAMEALSWMGSSGAAFASAIAKPDLGELERPRASNAIRDMCWSEDCLVRQAAMESFVQRPIHNEFVVIAIVPLMITACFDENNLVRLAASTALADQVRLLDEADGRITHRKYLRTGDTGWAAYAGILFLIRLCAFGEEVLKSKSCNASASDLKETFIPLLTSISLASGGDSATFQAESKNVKSISYEIREATVNLLGRLFQAAHDGDRSHYLEYLTKHGVHNKSSQVRKLSLQWLIDIHPEAACSALSVAKLMKKDRKQDVLTVAHSYFEVYADMVDLSTTGAINTDIPQLSTGNDEESEYYWTYDDCYTSNDEAIDFEEYWVEHQAANPMKGHGGASHDPPLNKRAMRKRAHAREAATAAKTQHAENEKGCDSRRRGARDAKCADAGRLLLSSALGQEG